MIRVRIALAPTGHLTLAQARIALVAALHAVRAGGHLTLRLDDLDTERCRPEFAQAMLHDLAWLGIGWDECARQSERADVYQDTIARLRGTGRLYPCFESVEELRAKADYRRKRGQATVYDRAMLRLTEAQRAAAEAGGKRPYWRFRLSDGAVAWTDRLLGRCEVRLPTVSDPIVVQADGTPTATLAEAADDIALQVTDVIRRADTLDHVAAQIDLRAALGDEPGRIIYAHLGVPAPARGGADARFAGQTVRGLRADGFVAPALAAYLVQDAIGPRPAPGLGASLAQRFDAARVRAVGLEPAPLIALNRAALAALPFDAVAGSLGPDVDPALWLAVRKGIDRLTEARLWHDIVAGPIVPPDLDGERELLDHARAALPAEPWTAGTAAAWCADVAARDGRPAQAVAALLYLAVTGEESGPALAALLPLLGRDRVAARLRDARGP